MNTEDGDIYLFSNLQRCNRCSNRSQASPNDHLYCRPCLNKLRKQMRNHNYRRSIVKLDFLLVGCISILFLYWDALILPIIMEFEWVALISSILLSLCFVVIALYYPSRSFISYYRQCLASLKNKVIEAYPLDRYE